MPSIPNPNYKGGEGEQYYNNNKTEVQDFLTNYDPDSPRIDYTDIRSTLGIRNNAPEGVIDDLLQAAEKDTSWTNFPPDPPGLDKRPE